MRPFRREKREQLVATASELPGQPYLVPHLVIQKTYMEVLERQIASDGGPGWDVQDYAVEVEPGVYANDFVRLTLHRKGLRAPQTNSDLDPEALRLSRP